MKTTNPNFSSVEFLRQHICSTMQFYQWTSLDPEGGFFHYFRDDGFVYDRSHRHLVSSTRFVFNNAMAFKEFGSQEFRQTAVHGLNYLRTVHRNPSSGGYSWTILDGKADDRTNHCYGLAFVLLAYSCGLDAGIAETKQWIDEIWQLLELHCWDEEFGLYRDEADENWSFTDYRGQNANMHMCEALLKAYEATGEAQFLARAQLIAENIVRRQSIKPSGLIWEHYSSDWQPNWVYHLDNPKHLFRPWGFQSGHQIEWAKLLLILNRYAQQNWYVTTAKQLFDVSLGTSWDQQRGGIYYGFAPDFSICDNDKYFWVQAEALATTALLAHSTGEEQYSVWYRKIWTYVWEYFVDHEHGAWYRILDADNHKYSDQKSPAGKTDYHTMGACYEILKAVRAQGSQYLE